MALSQAAVNEESGTYLLLLDEQQRRSNTAKENVEALRAAREKLQAAQEKGTAKFTDDIRALEKLRGQPGVVAAELDTLIAAYGRLEKQAALEAKVNEWSDYAKQLVPVVAAGLGALGSVSEEVAQQWSESFSSMVSDLSTFAAQLAQHNWAGAAITGLTAIFNWFGRNKRAAEEAKKATLEYNKQFQFSDNGYGTRTVQKYSTGFLFWQTDHYKETVNVASKSLALGLESGFTNGIKDGFTQALKQNDFSLFGKSLRQSVGEAVLTAPLTPF